MQIRTHFEWLVLTALVACGGDSSPTNLAAGGAPAGVGGTGGQGGLGEGGSSEGGSSEGGSSQGKGGATQGNGGLSAGGSSQGGSSQGGGGSSGEGGAPPLGGVCDGKAGTCLAADGCFACAITGPCKAQADACTASWECVALNKCYGNCDGDATCLINCNDIFAGGTKLIAAVLQCSLCQQCSSDCDEDFGGACAGTEPLDYPGAATPPDCDAAACGHGFEQCLYCAKQTTCFAQNHACTHAANNGCNACRDCINNCKGNQACAAQCEATNPAGCGLWNGLISCIHCDGCGTACAADPTNVALCDGGNGAGGGGSGDCTTDAQCKGNAMGTKCIEASYCGCTANAHCPGSTCDTDAEECN